MFQWLSGSFGAPAVSTFFQAVPGIFKPISGQNNCCNSAGTCFAMGILGSAFCSGVNAWQAVDGGTWWLRSSSFGEPSGDYTGNCLLWMGGIDVTAANIQFNDLKGCGCV
jgi:hypothetical protein